jgi:hypothetical protein
VDVEDDLAVVGAGREHLHPPGKEDVERVTVVALLQEDDVLAVLLDSAPRRELPERGGLEGGDELIGVWSAGGRHGQR